MQNIIPSEEVDSFLTKVKESMQNHSIRPEIIDETKIVVIHPDCWEISLFVPSKYTKASEIRRVIESILYNECGVEERCCDYLGKQNSKQSYEWYFRHPNIPQDIYERLERMIEQELGDEIGLGLPIPSGSKSTSDTVFLTLKEEFYNLIEHGEKTTEYRNLNQYYCDKFFSPGVKKKFVKFNRGYKTGEENQMIFEIAEMRLVSERGDEISPLDEKGNLITSFSKLPRGFAPVAYAIKLGNRKK